MKTNYTKKEWHYVDYAGIFLIQDGPFYEDHNLLDTDNFPVQAEANARLMSSAPELLSALSKIEQLSDMPGLGHRGEILLIAKQAIKKATEP